MTWTDVFWILVAVVVVFALLMVIDWHRVNRREAARDDHVYSDRRAEIRAQLDKLPKVSVGEIEEHRQRLARGKTPIGIGDNGQRTGRRRSS